MASFFAGIGLSFSKIPEIIEIISGLYFITYEILLRLIPPITQIGMFNISLALESTWSGHIIADSFDFVFFYHLMK